MTGIDTIQAFQTMLAELPTADQVAYDNAGIRNGQLTKPPGALGRLEELALWYASWRADPEPNLVNPQVIIFAGNHGVTARGVSAFPAEVTAQMVMNFQHGGAAINQLAKTFGASLNVHALDLDNPTVDISSGPAMENADFLAALNTGWNAVDPTADLLVTGEMGIGNTTSAAAIAAALMGGQAAEWTGRGTGIDDRGLDLKTSVVQEALQANPSREPLEILRCLGGRELAAIAGAIARARTLCIPVILDGFICCAAAATLEFAQPGALDHTVAGHLSAEGAHGALLERMGKKPMLNLGMRLGEGSGAALAIGVLKGAIACHSGMSTFAEAGVADG